jgi:methylase of polypeptide subunit release factors
MASSTLFQLQIRANHCLRRYVYRSPLITRLLYRCSLSSRTTLSYWELGTLAMRHALKRNLKDGMRVLEVGTGPYGVLALWAASFRRVEVIATELDRDWAASAAAESRANRRRVQVRHGDLLADAEGDFDLVWFVPPQTSAATLALQMQVLGIAAQHEATSLAKLALGGEQGWEICDRFLRAVRGRLRPGGRVLLAINRAHQADRVIGSLLHTHGFVEVESVRLPLLPYKVFVAGEPCR